MGAAALRPSLALAVFAVVQCADAWLTAFGIARFGPGIEGNPILAFYVATFGASTVVGAKLIAVACGAVLHLFARQAVLVVLTAAYVAFAVVPWLCVLVP